MSQPVPVSGSGLGRIRAPGPPGATEGSVQGIQEAREGVEKVG